MKRCVELANAGSGPWRRGVGRLQPADWARTGRTAAGECSLGGLQLCSLPYPQPTSIASRNRMRANRRANTEPEVQLRSALHAKGLRFRKDFPIRLEKRRIVYPDIVFTKKMIAVFVDGCFWHSCPEHGTTPKSNQDYWIPKLRQNAERDRNVSKRLLDAGWSVIRIWAHQPPEEAATVILLHLREKQSS